MDTLTPQAMHKLVFTILVHGLPDSQTGIALEVLGNALKSPNGQVRELAVVALSDLMVSPSKRVALLREALRDPYARVRRRAARALGDFGAHAHAVVPQIATGLRDPDPSVRRDSAGTLGRLGPVAAGAVPGLVSLLGDPETRTRVVAATALKRIGRDAVNGLLQGLQHANADLRARCVTLLVHLAPDDARVSAAAQLAGANSNVETRFAGQVQTPAPVATPTPDDIEEFAVAVG
jgi:HEAT repeat protein